MIQIDAGSPVVIYEQIKTGFRGLVRRGVLKPGDTVVSIRSLAETLVVNPNTVARAFRELVTEGVLAPRRGEGHVVAAGAPAVAKDSLEAARSDLAEAIRQARRAGLTWKDIGSALSAVKGGER